MTTRVVIALPCLCGTTHVSYETFIIRAMGIACACACVCVFAECKSESSYCRKGHEKRRNSARTDGADERNGQPSAGGNHGYVNLVNDRYASDERICQSTSTGGGGGGGGMRHQNSLTENSQASYTTSLSTDTLYWDEDPMTAAGSHSSAAASRQHSVKSQSSSTYRRENCTVKPVKSWDNLTTKAFGGYGFGYEYLDRDLQMANGGGGGGGGQQHMVYLQLKNVKGGQKHHGGGGGHHHHHHHHHQHHSNQHHHHHHHDGRIRHPTKSTEALLSLPPQYPIAAIESSASCEYLDACSAGSGYFGYVKNDKASQTDCRRYAAAHHHHQQQQQQQQPEVTRL